MSWNVEWPHGRVPIGDGCVDKQALSVIAKSHCSSASTTAYQNIVDEYEQMKERNEALERTNKKLKENNEILIEEKGVNHELMLVINNTFSFNNLLIICIDFMCLHIKIFREILKILISNHLLI